MNKIFAAAAFFVASVSSAIAAPVTIYFTAEDMFSFGFGAPDHEQIAFDVLGISQGDTITGSFTYDDAFPNARVEEGYESAIDTTSTMSLTIGDTAYDALTGRTSSSDVFDEIDVFVFERLITNALNPFNDLPDVVESSAYVLAVDDDISLWDGLSRSADDLNQAERRELQFGLTTLDGSSISIRSSSLTFSAVPIAAVPLPAGGALLVSSLFGLGLVRRRKR